MKTPARRLGDLEAELRARLEKEAGLEFVLLHGSAAKGLDFSDLDLAVSTSQKPARPWRYVAELANRLEAGLGATVDVHLVEEAPLEFRYQVSKGLPLFVADATRLADWREKTWSEYFRNQYFFEDYTRQLLRAAAGGVAAAANRGHGDPA